MAFIGNYDTTDVPPQEDFTPVPPGEYVVQILSSEMVSTKSGNGEMLKLELEIIEGPSAGRRLFDRLNLVNQNQQAVDIAMRQLSALKHATNRLQVQNSEELHGIPMIAVVKVDPPRGDYGPSNSIRTYKAKGNGIVQQQASRPAATQAASGGSQASTPPWKRNAA